MATPSSSPQPRPSAFRTRRGEISYFPNPHTPKQATRPPARKEEKEDPNPEFAQYELPAIRQKLRDISKRLDWMKHQAKWGEELDDAIKGIDSAERALTTVQNDHD
jgi:hypothetical protein